MVTQVLRAGTTYGPRQSGFRALGVHLFSLLKITSLHEYLTRYLFILFLMGILIVYSFVIIIKKAIMPFLIFAWHYM